MTLRRHTCPHLPLKRQQRWEAISIEAFYKSETVKETHAVQQQEKLFFMRKERFSQESVRLEDGLY